MFDNIAILAGSSAINIIRDEGLNLNRVKVLAGASGAAKFLVLTGIDRLLMTLFKDRKDPLYLIGTSIGAFRMAAFCQKDPITAINALEREYIAQRYDEKPTREEITEESWRILNAFISDDDIPYILNHPFMKVAFLANKCKGLVKSENLFWQMLGVGMAAGVNLFSRNGLKYFFERALFYPPGAEPPYREMNQFPLRQYALTLSNFKTALLASGSIPVAMEGISDVEGASGVFRDGGILDYHLDIPFTPDNECYVLYPHFYDTITPGWFDKQLKRKPQKENMKNVIIVAPSQHFVTSLPQGRIPDRKDFKILFGKDEDRMALWKKAAQMNQVLADEFHEAMVSGKIKDIVKPLNVG